MTSARSTASRVHDSTALHGLARAGFAMNGVLHLLIGGLALAVAFGGSATADQNGALEAVASHPGGIVLLWVIVVGMFALGLFQILTTALVRGSDKDAWASRAKEAGKAVAYFAIGGTALRFAMGSSGGGDAAESLSGKLLATPGGVILLVVVALGVLAIGAYFIVKGAKKKFLDDLTTQGGQATRVVGTLGYIAKGIAIAIVGLFFGVAAFTADPDAAAGLDGALKSLVDLPFGPVLLAVVALGLVAYGLYCFARARWARL
jgi:hypothetical protein